MHIHVLADRPDLRAEFEALGGLWPRFMLEDPIADLYFTDLDPWLDHIIVGVLDGVVVAKGYSVGFELDGPDDLPTSGWDGVVMRAAGPGRLGRRPNACSALEISILPAHRGTGISGVMLAALRENAARLGYDALYAPVRPNGKPDEPATPMQEYAFRTREDGLPFDPWLRVHVRAGGEILRVAPTSMIIRGTLEEWRSWTGLPFDTTGDVEVPGALVPVHVDVEHDHAVYIEPNVWVRHAL